MIQVIAFAFLAHSIYSAREGYQAGRELSADIILEAALGLVLLVGTKWHRLTLKPDTVAGDLSAREARGQNPFTLLETRPNFQDVGAKRSEYLTWKQSGSGGSGSGR